VKSIRIWGNMWDADVALLGAIIRMKECGIKAIWRS